MRTARHEERHCERSEERHCERSEERHCERSEATPFPFSPSQNALLLGLASAVPPSQ
ncbi:MAG: hypothetical protein LBE13_11275 [Bacteroidales bacterium]|nr:hypothetical protein [Bacteroidales bacterium]